MKSIKSYRIFQFVLMTYLVSAFSWWAILLLKKNEELYELKTEVIYSNKPGMQAMIYEDYKRSRMMIIGEGIVFAVSILISLYIVNRAFWAEIKANKNQNNFLLSVTHELKTPISTLKLINQTLQKKNINEDKRQELLLTAYDESLRLESLVNNILTAAQMDNNYHFNFEDIDLNEILEARTMRFKKLYPDANISLTNEAGKRTVKADREAITKLADNLIDNALKYSGQNTTVDINIGRIREQMYLSISDNGPGIAEEEKKKVLDKFYRIGNEDERVSKGTGLGLFIVREICRAHSAKLDILNKEPSGTIFKISFSQ